MRIDKRKIILVTIPLVVVIFIIVYAIGLQEGESKSLSLELPEVPELGDEKKEYDSRLKAVEQLMEEKEVSPPALYKEENIDFDGSYDPYLEDREKQMLMDSILGSGPDLESYEAEQSSSNSSFETLSKDPGSSNNPSSSNPGHGHSNFFLQSGLRKKTQTNEQHSVRAAVHGDQVVRKDQRLELKLLEPLFVNGDTIAKHTVVYAFCSFQPNRLLLDIKEIGGIQLKMSAYDISDGQQGIYIENSFQSQATSEILDDVIQDINISGLPQVSGLKRVFQRSNSNVKVKVLHQYQLYLKPKL